MKYCKPPLSVKEQIELLVSRGLIVSDINIAEHTFSNISYYRLSSYLYPFRVPDSPNQDFYPDTSLDEILKVYSFDRKLRLLIFDAIERIEIAFRAQLSLVLAFNLSVDWFAQPEHFADINKFESIINSFKKELALSKEVFIQHFLNKYTETEFPPSWIALEIFTFGQLSSHYSNLKDKKAKQKVSVHFKVQSSVLESWLHSLSYLRNLCAHHSRIWNRNLGVRPLIPSRKNFNWLLNQNIHNNKLYFSLSIIQFLLNTIHPNNTFSEKLRALINHYPRIDLKPMGFPINWLDEPFWSITKD